MPVEGHFALLPLATVRWNWLYEKLSRSLSFDSCSVSLTAQPKQEVIKRSRLRTAYSKPRRLLKEDVRLSQNESTVKHFKRAEELFPPAAFRSRVWRTLQAIVLLALVWRQIFFIYKKGQQEPCTFNSEYWWIYNNAASYYSSNLPLTLRTQLAFFGEKKPIQMYYYMVSFS